MEIGFIDTPERWRDVFIMSFMAAGTVLFLVGIVFTLIIGLLSVRTALMARSVIRDSLRPALENVRETTGSVRGTVTFISDYAVTPVVRAYSAYAGARRFVVVFLRFARPKRAG